MKIKLNEKMNERDIKEYILHNYKEEVIEMAYENWAPTTLDGIVYYNMDTEELEGQRWTSNTKPSPEYNVIEIYRLKGNWVNNNDWNNHNDLLTDEEYEKLEKKYEEIYYYDKEQVQSIGVDYDERMKEYLVYCL